MEAERGNSLNGYSNFVHSDVLVPFRRESYPGAARAPPVEKATQLFAHDYYISSAIHRGCSGCFHE